eukprot:8519924-Alexandrium_andersonii.AAC.1
MLGDIREVGVWPLLAGATVVAAGLPCQSTTRAGMQLARNDARDLWRTWVLLLRAARPPFA